MMTVWRHDFPSSERRIPRRIFSRPYPQPVHDTQAVEPILAAIFVGIPHRLLAFCRRRGVNLTAVINPELDELNCEIAAPKSSQASPTEAHASY